MAAPLRTTPGFFRQPAPIFSGTTKAVKKPEYVNVGGNGDCGPRSVAANIIDFFLDNPRMKSDFISNILAQHVSYFPQHRTRAIGLVTATERMQQLIKQVSMAELIPSLGFTLRQMGVDEMVAHPAHYRGPFIAENEGTSPKKMREPSTWMDESLMAAIASTTGLPIEVRVVQHGKELPMRRTYNETSSNPKVTIQLQNKHYIPMIANVDRFKASLSQVSRAITPDKETAKQDPSLTEILAIIAEDDKRLLSEFESNKHRLTAMVNAGELNKDDLIGLYVKGMKNSDYLQGRIKYVGTEHGHQHFFEAITHATDVVQFPRGSQDQQIISELVHGIARAVSIGQMSADAVFAQIDNNEETSTLHAHR